MTNVRRFPRLESQGDAVGQGNWPSIRSVLVLISEYVFVLGVDVLVIWALIRAVEKYAK